MTRPDGDALVAEIEHPLSGGARRGHSGSDGMCPPDARQSTELPDA